MTARMLMILTSTARMGSTERATGLWAEELAVPYYALRDAGLEVVLASTAGGAVPIDPSSVRPVGENEPVLERFLADTALQAQLRSTPTAASMALAPFAALFFPGGHGTMWDLPHDAGVTRLVAQAYAEQKYIAAVCHGVAGLVSAQRPEGGSIVQGRRVNCFTNAEEAAVGLTELVPFLLESRLRELGGVFEGAANWQAFALRDGPLITGQNPQSSAAVVQLLLQALAEPA